MSKPDWMKQETYEALVDEAQAMPGTIRWGVPHGDYTPKESNWFWNVLIYQQLGYGDCSGCGTWTESPEELWDGELCDQCAQDEQEHEGYGEL